MTSEHPSGGNESALRQQTGAEEPIVSREQRLWQDEEGRKEREKRSRSNDHGEQENLGKDDAEQRKKRAPLKGELSKLKTATVVGIEAVEVEVEVDTSNGIPGCYLVGLPNGAVREGTVRIKSALHNSGYEIGPVRVTVNLAPADLRKDGAAFELPIAIGILQSRKKIEIARAGMMLAGELSLDGAVKPIRGALSLAEAARRAGASGLVLPRANAAEAALVEGIDVFGVETLVEAISFIRGETDLDPTRQTEPPPGETATVDFSEVCGQSEARRAAEVAAAGGHNLILIGPPGSGKTMIARRIGTVLPPLSRTEAIEVTKIHSVAGLLNGVPLLRERPFRAPHHTCSIAGLVGGGSNPRPGEVSLAHNGVLFLDELPEFQRGSLEALRQPVEDGVVTVARIRQVVTFPARFMLVAAMNPCPCGYRGTAARTCTCGEREARRYINRISGPLLDRFDIFVQVAPVEARSLFERSPAESSAEIANRVAAARARQQHRFRRARAHCNAQMSDRLLRRHVPLASTSQKLLQEYAEARGTTARSLHRAWKVARTLGDLEDKEDVSQEHLLNAISLQQGRWVR